MFISDKNKADGPIKKHRFCDGKNTYSYKISAFCFQSYRIFFPLHPFSKKGKDSYEKFLLQTTFRSAPFSHGEALNRANSDHAMSYGSDPWTEEAVRKIKEMLSKRNVNHCLYSMAPEAMR